MHSATPSGGRRRGDAAARGSPSGTSGRKASGGSAAAESARTRPAARRTGATGGPGGTGKPGHRAPAEDPGSPPPSGAPPAGPWPPRGGAGRGRIRRELYGRGARADERWPMVARLLSRPLRHPEAVLGLLGERGPVERDGRVLHPGIQAMLAMANRLGMVKAVSSPADLPSPFDMRRHLRRAARAVMPVRTDVHVTGRVIPGPGEAPPIGLRTYRRFGAGLTAGPGSRRRLPALVFFHGGGWVTGDLDSHDALCRILAVASGCLVVAVDYRLAPEFPFPAAVDDALAAYSWVHEHGGELGIDPGRIGVMGDSAGANLATVVAQVTRDGVTVDGRAVPPPIAQGLVYPVVDARMESESIRSVGEGFLLTRTVMEYYRDHYLPDRAEWENPLASPLLLRDLSGLAPALVVTAGFDPLRDDGTAYAEALRRAGVAVEERRYDDQIHGFMILGIVPDSLAVATEVCESMGRLMRHAPPIVVAG